ncbi:MAG: hypothetical protein M3155_02805 [Actinomycetota bacterium]|nr:hypothetical protein [Actinomycetota bacterium]
MDLSLHAARRAPALGQDARARLAWRPPVLIHPARIVLRGGATETSLDPSRDYVVVLPRRRKVGATILEGGHNILLRGGYITIPRRTPPGAENDQFRRAIYIKNNTGTVHIEGVKIDGSGGGQSDGIAINSPLSVVQVENVRVTGLTGTDRGFHSDVIQPWGGVRALRVDRLTGTTDYQGLFLPTELGPIGTADLRHVNLSSTTARSGVVLLWLTGVNACSVYPLRISNLYVEAHDRRGSLRSVYPRPGTRFGCPAILRRGGSLTWPALPVRGVVHVGKPPGGDFVPAGVAGIHYRG